MITAAFVHVILLVLVVQTSPEKPREGESGRAAIMH